MVAVQIWVNITFNVKSRRTEEKLRRELGLCPVWLYSCGESFLTRKRPMPLTATHPTYGNLHAWELSPSKWLELKESPDRKALVMKCGSGAIAKTSSTETQFFAHKPNSNCSGHAGESPEHLRLKTFLAKLAQAAGFVVSIEDRHVDGVWVSDVMIERDNVRTALEVQLSPQSVEETLRRSQRYSREGVNVVWFLGEKVHRSLRDLRELENETVFARLGNYIVSGSDEPFAPTVAIDGVFLWERHELGNTIDPAERDHHETIRSSLEPLTMENLTFLATLRRHRIGRKEEDVTFHDGLIEGVGLLVDDEHCGHCDKIITRWGVDSVHLQTTHGAMAMPLGNIPSCCNPQYGATGLGDWEEYLSKIPGALPEGLTLAREVNGPYGHYLAAFCPWCNRRTKPAKARHFGQTRLTVTFPTAYAAPFLKNDYSHWCTHMPSKSPRHDRLSGTEWVEKVANDLTHSPALHAYSHTLEQHPDNDARERVLHQEWTGVGDDEADYRDVLGVVRRRLSEFFDATEVEVLVSQARAVEDLFEVVAEREREAIAEQAARLEATERAARAFEVQRLERWEADRALYRELLSVPVEGIRYQAKASRCVNPNCSAEPTLWRVAAVLQEGQWRVTPRPRGGQLGMQVEEVLGRIGVGIPKAARYSHARVDGVSVLAFTCFACATVLGVSFDEAPGQVHQLDSPIPSTDLFTVVPEEPLCRCAACSFSALEAVL